MEVDENSLEFRPEFPRIVHLASPRESRCYTASEKDKGAGEGFLKYGTVGERATKVS